MARGLHRAAIVLVRVLTFALVATVLVGCVHYPRFPDPPPEPTTAAGLEGCTFDQPDADAVVVWSYGAPGTEGRQAFVAFRDGHVDITRYDADAKAVVTRTATVDTARIEQLESDLVDTKVLDDKEGCYGSNANGETLVFRSHGVPKDYRDNGSDLPDGVDDAFHVARAFLDEFIRHAN